MPCHVRYLWGRASCGTASATHCAASGRSCICPAASTKHAGGGGLQRYLRNECSCELSQQHCRLHAALQHTMPPDGCCSAVHVCGMCSKLWLITAPCGHALCGGSSEGRCLRMNVVVAVLALCWSCTGAVLHPAACMRKLVAATRRKQGQTYICRWDTMFSLLRPFGPDALWRRKTFGAVRAWCRHRVPHCRDSNLAVNLKPV